VLEFILILLLLLLLLLYDSTNARYISLLGFLSTEDDVIPGNYGMKDQVLALQWVQENIDKFGGDPGKVTIFGGSSGGASTGYHMLSPMSKGLFHKAILQSGTPLCRWSTYLPGVARDRSKIISRIAGCDGNSSSTNMLKCLKALPERFFSDVYEKLWVRKLYLVFHSFPQT
jgi:carboxylesterase type B